MAHTSHTVIGAAHWASYLINGDASGLDDSDIEYCKRWLFNEVGEGDVVDCGEPYFTWSYRLHTGCPFDGGDVVEYTVLSCTTV